MRGKLTHMNGELTVRDVLGHEFVGVSESDSVSETASLLLAESVPAAVVLRGDEPVGLLTERDALSALAAGVDAETTAVSDVMYPDVPAVDASNVIESAIERMRAEGVRWLVVETEDGVEGVLTESDLLTAVTLDGHRETPSVERSPEPHDGGSICQECGAFTRDLLDREGNLLCPSCRAQ